MYRRYISILNLQWKYTWKWFLGILTLMCMSEGIFLYREFTNKVSIKEHYDWSAPSIEPWVFRFEEYLARSHVKGFFVAAIILTVLLLISVPLRQRSVSVVEYSYGRLPVRKGSWQFMTGIHALLHLLMVLGVQFGMIIGAYYMYLTFIPKEAQMTQGLFLAFIRWDFLRAVFPISDMVRLTYLVIIMFSLVAIVIYLPLCIQKKNKSFIPFLICGYYYLSFIKKVGLTFIILSSLILIATILFMFFISNELLKQDSL